MTDNLNKEELAYFIEFLTLIATKNEKLTFGFEDPYLTKFYKFPLLR